MPPRPSELAELADDGDDLEDVSQFRKAEPVKAEPVDGEVQPQKPVPKPRTLRGQGDEVAGSAVDDTARVGDDIGKVGEGVEEKRWAKACSETADFERSRR